ncbi:MAG: hypothetical protein ACTHOD_19865 [Motilibacteraceae bacterium]
MREPDDVDGAPDSNWEREPGKPLLAPVVGPETWRSLQPAIDAEISWGNAGRLDWTMDPHNETWVARLRDPMHATRLRETFDFAPGVRLTKTVEGWQLSDGNRSFLVSANREVPLAPGGRAVATDPISRILTWLDVKLNGPDPN